MFGLPPYREMRMGYMKQLAVMAQSAYATMSLRDSSSTRRGSTPGNFISVWCGV